MAAVAQICPNQVEKGQIATLAKNFKAADKNNNGTLSAQEILGALNAKA